MKVSRELKASFIVTFSAVAACAGKTSAVCDDVGPCDGADAAIASDAGNDVTGQLDSASADALADVTTADMGAVCPTLPPKSGEACSGSLSCTWGKCPPDQVVSGFCKDGKWSIAQMSCNPPMPDSGVPTCPASMPVAGTACSGTLDCAYKNGSGCPDNRAKCDNGKWTVIIAPCNPPPPPVDAGQP